MITKIKIAWVVIGLLLISNYGHAQQDSAVKIADSVHNEFLILQSQQLHEMELMLQQDSIKKVALENKINSLTTADNTKKQALLLELDELKNKEAARLESKQQKIDSLRNFVKGYPVVPFLDDTLFIIYNKLGSLSAKDRAEAINNRVIKLADNYFFATDSMQIIKTETTVDLVYGETIIMGISENDAIWQSTSKENLASKYKTIIGNAVIGYKEATSWQTISKQIGLSLLVLLALGMLIYFIVKLFRFTTKKIEAQKDKLIKGISIRSYEFLNAGRQISFFLLINRIIKWIVLFTVIYLTLPALFSIFPWTENFATTLISYFVNPLKGIFGALWNYLPNLITIIVIVFVFRYAIKGIAFLKSEIENGNLKLAEFYPDWAAPTFQIVKVLLYAFMLVVIFPYLPGSDSPIFRGVSVFLGVMFTFGSSGSLSNIIAGLVLTYMRAFKIGDRVKIGDITGDIIEKSLLVTRIRTIKNEIISIPNSNVMSSHTINYSSDAPANGLIMHSTVTIGYDVPWKNMHKALIDAALRTEHLLPDPKPFVLQTSLEDFYVSYQINAYTKEPNKQSLIYSQLHQNIQDCCNEVGIEIMSPHYRAARDGNNTTIPAEYLNKDYEAPGFNVNIKKD